MEQSRLIVAIILSVVVLIGWQLLFVDNKPKLKNNASEQIVKNKLLNKQQPIKKINNSTSIKEEKPINAKQILINTPFYKVKIDEKGGVFKSFLLKNYKKTMDSNSPLKQLISDTNTTGTLNTFFQNNTISNLNEKVFTANTSKDVINVTNSIKDISFSWKSKNGITVVKTFTFFPDNYIINLSVNIKNNSNQQITDNLIVELTNTNKIDSKYGFEGPSAFINNKLEEIETKKIKNDKFYTGNISWVSIEDRYFMSSLIPNTPVGATMRLTQNSNIVNNQYIQPSSTINQGVQSTFNYLLYFGPKDTKILAKVGHNLDKIVNFGWFDIIAKPCLWLMNFIYSLIPNYGFAIIILTIIIKLILWPLGNKSYKSMSEMKKIQPLMAEIRKKYKSDKKKMNAEIMNLYKTYKINPIGGCLPMVLQIPVFFALYRMLYEAIELRHAPFILWIKDLSAPDRLFDFGVKIPFMDLPTGIPVLTIIMGLTMIIQQKMSPPPGDPTQAKMMMLMPVVFTVIFINFPAGLVLYWLVNNVTSILQQYYVTKKV